MSVTSLPNQGLFVFIDEMRGLLENIRVAPVFSGRPGPGQAWLRHESTSSRTTTIPAQPSSAPVVPNQIEGTKEPWAAASKVKKMEHNSLLSFDQ